jgi:DNA-binding CsgD family transcriptional regulator
MNQGTVTIRPRARDFIIKRPRLTKLLDEAGARVLLLVAPAGYGKTTLAREWTAEKEKVGWYAGGPAMADVAALAVGLAETLSSLGAPARDDVLERVRILAARGHDPRGLAKAVAAGAPGPDWLLVIDDYHYAAESSESEAFIEELVALTEFGLLLTSRERPGWLAARKVVYGEAAVVEMKALAFTDEEARAVLGDVGGGDHEEIVSEACGWPAVIGLAAMRPGRGSPDTRVPASDLYEFFADDMLRSCSGRLRRALFLLALSGEAATEVARDVLGEDRDRLFAEALDRGFLSRGDGGQVTIHPLLIGFLLAKIKELQPDEVDTAVESVVASLARHKSWDPCLATLRQFPRTDLIRTSFAQALDDLLDAGRTPTIETWLSLAAEHQIADPLLLSAEAEIALRRGDNRGAQAHGERAGALLTGDLSARAYLVAARAAYLSDDTSSTTLNCERAYNLARAAETKADALWVEFASASERHSAEAHLILDRLRGISDARPSHSLRLLTAKAFLLAEAGDVRASIRELELASSLVSKVHDPFARTSFLYIFAHENILRARYEDALTLLAQQVADARQSGLQFAADHALIKRSSALIGLRQLRGAQGVIHTLRSRSIHASDYLVDNTLIQETKLRIALGDIDGAAMLLDREPTDSRRLSFRSELLAYRTLVYAARGDIASAKELLAKNSEASRFSEAAALCDLSVALIDLQHGSSRSAVSTLTRLIERDLRDPIVTAYRAWPMLAKVGAEDPTLAREMTETLTRARDVDIGRRAGFQIPRELRKRQRLSAREEQVYDLLIQGRQNREIAKTLFITESTTKVHVRHIFEKLDVHSRVEAARMATLDELD